MTGIELEASGVRFFLENERIVVGGPKGRADLLSEVQFQVASRQGLFDQRGRFMGRRIERRGACYACGDVLTHDAKSTCSLCEDSPTGLCLTEREGWICALCAVARDKAQGVKR